MAFNEYTWDKYYENLYHAQKKMNNQLAVELGESTSKEAELKFALNRLTGSPFWKALAPVRKLNSIVHHENAGMTGAKPERAITDNTFYRSRLAAYEDFYGQWIRRDESEQKYSGEEYRTVDKISEPGIIFASIEDLDEINRAVDNIKTGEWLVFTGNDGYAAKGFAKRLKEDLADNPNSEIWYADEDYMCYLTSEKRFVRFNPFFKPDWSPDTLDSFFYLGNICAIKADLLHKVGFEKLRTGYESVYNLFLKASEVVGKHYDEAAVRHFPQIMWHNSVEESVYDAVSTIKYTDAYDFYWSQINSAAKLCDKDEAYIRNIIGLRTEGSGELYNDIKLEALKRRCGGGNMIMGQDTEVFQMQYPVGSNVKVSVLILTKDHPEVLKTCLSSFVERTDYDNLEFVIVDNGSSEENKKQCEELISIILKDIPYKYVYKPMDFNFSALCNIAASEAGGELFLFLNDDIEIVQKDWLKLMAGYALLPHIGAVGAKLLYAHTDKIQHIGITNLEIGPSHKLVIYPDDRNYYYGRNILAYDMIGVTAACLLISSDKFRKIGGFNEEFAVAYNDVDFCMKLCEAGYNNLQCNGALLYHYESMTRGQDAGDSDKWNRLLHEKEKLYLIHPKFFGWDPYYNINMIGNHSNYLSKYDFDYNNHLKTEIVRQIDASKLAEKTPGNEMISIDFAGIQTRNNLGEPDIAEVKGWCFSSGEDNSEHIVKIILKRVANTDGNVAAEADYELVTNVMPRDDLEKTFPNESNIRLCGFVTKVFKEDLLPGTYKVGVVTGRLKQDLSEQEFEKHVIFTDKCIDIEG